MIHPPCFAPEYMTFQEVGTYTFRLTSELCYYASNGTRYTVPPGFETDFLSIPRVFWRVIPPHGRGRKAAVLHDFLVRNHFKWNQAAALFREALAVCGEARWRVAAMYWAVRLYGAVKRKP